MLLSGDLSWFLDELLYKAAPLEYRMKNKDLITGKIKGPLN